MNLQDHSLETLAAEMAPLLATKLKETMPLGMFRAKDLEADAQDEMNRFVHDPAYYQLRVRIVTEALDDASVLQEIFRYSLIRIFRQTAPITPSRH